MRTPTYPTGVSIARGDWVRVYSSQLGVWHHGIVGRLVLVPGGVRVEIIHNMKGHGVAVVDWHDFADGGRVVLHRRPESPAHAAYVVATAEENIRKPYALFAQNCEHFASFAFTGTAQSETVRVLAWIVGVAAAAILISE